MARSADKSRNVMSAKEQRAILAEADDGDSEENLLPVRQEMVERGRRLLEDPNYPNLEIARSLASILYPALR